MTNQPTAGIAQIQLTLLEDNQGVEAIMMLPPRSELIAVVNVGKEDESPELGHAFLYTGIFKSAPGQHQSLEDVNERPLTSDEVEGYRVLLQVGRGLIAYLEREETYEKALEVFLADSNASGGAKIRPPDIIRAINILWVKYDE